MRVFCISSFPPKHCGIAEFHQSLIKELVVLDPSIQFQSIAINAADIQVDGYPGDVVYQVRKHFQEDYLSAAEIINNSDADLVLFEHEFSLFAGDTGSFGFDLINAIHKPIVLIAHTIPVRQEANNPLQKGIFFSHLPDTVKKIVVTLPEGKKWLVSLGIPESKIAVIDHGAPDVRAYPTVDIRKEFDIPDSHMIGMSFGLFYHGKGIHLAVEAMKYLKEKNLPLTYLIFSQPLRGEENIHYLELIKTIIRENNLEDVVRMNLEYVENTRLYGILQSVDFGMLPYQSRSQVSSGAISYFLAAGKPVISTEFPYAAYLGKSGGITFVPYEDAHAIAVAVEEFIRNPEVYNRKKKEAEAIGETILWSKKAKEYLTIMYENNLHI